MGSTGSPILDPDTIAELRRAKAAFDTPLLIRQLVEIYRANAPKRIDQLRSAVAGGDGRMLALAAHTLKANSAMLGAGGMAVMCAALEDYGEHSKFDEASAVLARVEAEFGRVLEALAELVSEEPEHA